MEFLDTAEGMRAFVAKASIEGEGFWMVHDTPFTAVVVPAGYMVAISGNFKTAAKGEDLQCQGAEGSRWGVMDSSDKSEVQQVHKSVSQILQAYPALRQGDYSTWLMCLEKYLLPACSSSGTTE